MSNIIDSIQVSGTVYQIQGSGGGNPTVELTQAQYDALVSAGTVSPTTYYIITDAESVDLDNYYTKSETSGATQISTALNAKADTATTYTKTEVDTALGGKQATLVSGTNIKTINNESILGSGNIDIQGGGSSYTAGDGIDITNDVISVTGKADTSAVTESINAAVSGKVDTSTFNTYSGSVETALSGKQDTLSAGTNITIVDNVISATGGGGGGGTTYTAGTGIDITNDVISVTGMVNTSAITSSVTSASTDSEIPTAKAVFDAIPTGGSASYSAGTNIDITNDTISCTLPIKQITGYESVIIGDERNTVNGQSNVAVGYQNSIKAKDSSYIPSYCFVSGQHNNVINDNEAAFGTYNNPVQNTSIGGASGTTIFSVGNGTSNNARHNAFEIRQNGDIYCNNGTSDVKLQDTITATAANTTALGGLKLVKLTQQEYDALTTKDSNTLYVIV